MTNDVSPVTPEEMDAAYSGPAPFTNKFVTTILGPIVRIAFLETRSPEMNPRLRGAVSMMLPDAIQLRDLLARMLAEAEEAVQKAQQGSPEDDSV